MNEKREKEKKNLQTNNNIGTRRTSTEKSYAVFFFSFDICFDSSFVNHLLRKIFNAFHSNFCCQIRDLALFPSFFSTSNFLADVVNMHLFDSSWPHMILNVKVKRTKEATKKKNEKTKNSTICRSTKWKNPNRAESIWRGTTTNITLFKFYVKIE